MIDENLNGPNIIAVPLADESDMTIGYITHSKTRLSRLGETYLEAIKNYAKPNADDTDKRTLKRRGRFNELNDNGEMLVDAGAIAKEHMKKSRS